LFSCYISPWLIIASFCLLGLENVVEEKQWNAQQKTNSLYAPLFEDSLGELMQDLLK